MQCSARSIDHHAPDLPPIDVLVEFDPGRKTFDNFLALCELLERLLDHTVELVTIEALSPYIGPHILAEAKDVVRAA